MKQGCKTNYEAPQTVPVKLELEQCIAQSSGSEVESMFPNVLIDESLIF